MALQKDANIMDMDMDMDYADMIIKVRDKYPDTLEITCFPLMHIGWEMDNVGAVARLADGTFRLFSTGHGSLYEMKRSELAETIDKYKQVVKECEDALRIYLGQKATG